jgi:hypothetical protein
LTEITIQKDKLELKDATIKLEEKLLILVKIRRSDLM